MVEVKRFIFPRYSREVETELESHDLKRAYSFGSTRLGNLRVLGKGKTGVVVLVEGNMALKIRRVDSPKESLELEARLQLWAEGVAPKVFDYGRNFILMEFVPGRHLTRDESPEVLMDLLERARRLEELKIEHRELVHPWKNVLVTRERTYILDYDSASMRESAFNVNKILNAYGLHELARRYKRREMSFEEVIPLILQLFRPS